MSTTKTTPEVTPPPVVGLYDERMWETIRARAMELQCCDACGASQYPPAPVCTHCGGERLAWKAVSGEGTIISWVISVVFSISPNQSVSLFAHPNR